MIILKSQKSACNGETEPIDRRMAGSNVHKQLGIWPIDTVNGNSWTGSSKYLEFTGADIAMVQEAKLRGKYAIQSAEDAALGHGWKTAVSQSGIGKLGCNSAE